LPIMPEPLPLNPHWISGFITGEGSFTSQESGDKGYIYPQFKIHMDGQDYDI